MHGAGQTPHGARPNREEIPAAMPECVPARDAKLPGRSLEPSSDVRPRGMTVTAATPYKIRLIGPMLLVAPAFGNERGGFQLLRRDSLGPSLRSGFRQRAPASLTPTLR